MAIQLLAGKNYISNADGTPMVGGQIFTYDVGTTNPRPTFADQGQINPNTNPVVLDGRGEALIFWSGDYTVVLQDVLGNTIWSVDHVNSNTASLNDNYVLDSGSANVYIGNGGIQTTTYVAGMKIALKVSTSNTGPSTFNYNALGTKQILIGPTQVFAGQLVAGAISLLEYDGANWQLLNPQGLVLSITSYGGDPTGVLDSSSAFQAAVNSGFVFIPANSSYLIVTPATYTGKIVMIGQGKTSKLLCDTTVLTVTGGSGSQIDNFWMESVTAPWIISRNPALWTANALSTLQQSTAVVGYQPTSNDSDLWGSLSPAQQSQNIGPELLFTGSASGINVGRVYGQFVRVTIQDAIDSVIYNCEIRGGKGQLGSLVFDNCTNNVQRGTRNRAVGNRVIYSSFSGVTFVGNDDGEIKGNHCHLCGESGTKTFQAGGIAFTASVGSATTGTLSTGWSGPTASTWNVGFADGSTRTAVTLTQSNTAISWTGALNNANILNAAVWGVAGFPASNMDPRNGRMQIIDNHCNDNYFDGLDCGSVYNITNDCTKSQHQISLNYAFRNRGDGINVDGQQNSVVGNHLYFNSSFGIWGICSYCNITGNTLIDNNQARVSSQSDILAVGALANNKIADNYIFAGGGQNNNAISVTPGTTNFISDNVTNGSFSFGNVGQVTGVVDGNIDVNTGALSPQSFCFQIVNNGGTLQHIFYADASGSGAGLYGHVTGATSGGFTNTPIGTDSSTAMAAGAKIGSVATNVVYFNTAAQPVNYSLMNASLVFNNSGTAVTMAPVLLSININGVTQYRLAFQFFNATTGAAFALNTTNVPTGKGIYVQFTGKLA